MPLFASRLFGSSPFSSPSGVAPAPTPGDLPADLDAAIAARFAADATLPTLATGGLHNGAAPDSARMPYVVFRVSGGSAALETDTSTWLDQQVRFDCTAATTEAAGAMARAVVAAFGGADATTTVSLAFATGVTAPLALRGNAEAATRQRGRDNARVCRAAVTYTAKVRLGRPS